MSCPKPSDRASSLTEDCSADMCREEDHNSNIFINLGGEFRRRMVTTLHCLSKQNNCIRTLERNKSKDCRADSYKNLDSGVDCQCSWDKSNDQTDCLKRMYKFQPTTFNPNQIICCRDTNSTIFNLKEIETQHSNIEICSEEHLSKCEQKWTSWSGWEV